MKYTYGTIIAVVSALFFYVRLTILQRRKVKNLTKTIKNERKKNRSSAGKESGRTASSNIPKLEFTSPYILGLGILLIIFGAVISAAPWFPVQTRELWWIPVSVGILLMSIVIR
jgi:hypothetical protein